MQAEANSPEPMTAVPTHPHEKAGAQAQLRQVQAMGVQPIGIWTSGEDPPGFTGQAISQAIEACREPLHIVFDARTRRTGVGRGGIVAPLGTSCTPGSSWYLLATLPPLYPEWLGARSFLETHRVRFPYVAGAMYKGIASASMVIAMARAGMLGFLGTAGMSLEEVRRNLDEIEQALGDSGASWGTNLIYMPTEPELENAIVDHYIKRGVRRISASAYMALSAGVVRYAATGLHRDGSGNIVRRNHVFAKISRVEVARPFMEPAPAEILSRLQQDGLITAEEAALAAQIPVAGDITVESDSGGHTDNRIPGTILPGVIQLRDELSVQYGYATPIRIGAAGGLGTPLAVAAAFASGADYVLTGSVNQASFESGMSTEGKRLLAAADETDVTMAPAADMFELGVKVQVLKRGTMFSNRAANLYQIYASCDSIADIPGPVREKLEKEVFRDSLDGIWEQTRAFFAARQPGEIEKADRDPKHRMALVFRWYLGNSAHWALAGAKDHRVDYQICCGPAMGAFNRWVRDSFLESIDNRSVVQIALNLLEGAAAVTRAQQLRTYGVAVPGAAFHFRPRPLQIMELA